MDDREFQAIMEQLQGLRDLADRMKLIEVPAWYTWAVSAPPDANIDLMLRCTKCGSIYPDCICEEIDHGGSSRPYSTTDQR